MNTSSEISLEIREKWGRSVTVPLSSEQAQALFSTLQETLVDPLELGESHDVVIRLRKSIRWLRLLSNAELRIWLRETSTIDVENILWLSRDPVLVKRCLSCLSPRAATMLMDDLEKQTQGEDPDHASGIRLESLSITVEDVNATGRRLFPRQCGGQ